VVIALAGIGLLAAARYLTTALWIDALWGVAACIGLELALLVGLLLRRSAGTWWQAWAALLLGVAAAIGRWRLVAVLQADAAAQRTIDFLNITVAASSVVWGALALLWGTSAIADAVERPPGTRRIARAALLAAAAAVALALYALAPLWWLLGLRINIWTVAGLFGLALTAYAVSSLYRWLLGPRRRKEPHVARCATKSRPNARHRVSS
jgi:hypothetical protein